MNISATQPTTATEGRTPASPATRNTVVGGTASAAGPSKVSQHNALEVSSGGMILSTATRQELLNLGTMAIGKIAIDDWSVQGLDVSEESLIAAAKALQDGFKQIVDKLGTKTAGSSVSINKHQIVINEQLQAPDWFIREYETALAMLDDPAHQQAFSQGALFFTSLPAATDPGAFTYQAVAQYR